MKKLLILCLLASACNSSPALTPTQEKVSAYLKKTLDDPASYQPVRWGKVTPYLTTEAERQEFGQLMAAYKIQQDSVIDYIQGEAAETEVARLKVVADAAAHRADVLAKTIDRQEAAKDSSRAGLAVQHTFRAKNKMGALVLDSARFIVANDGSITALK